MKWVGLVLLWVVSGALGLYLAQQESLSIAHAGLIVGWLAVAIGVSMLFVRRSRKGPGGPA